MANITKDYLPFKDEINEKVDSIAPEFENTIGQIIANGNDIYKTRKMLGDAKGTIGRIKGKNMIKQIWNIIGPTCAGVSPDRLFGFDPVDKQGYETFPIYLGILGCCAVLDIVGFQAEKKCRKISKIPNVKSDAGHIAMGAFCSVILSEDRRLIKRAIAIYEYKDINTSTLLVSNRANKIV